MGTHPGPNPSGGELVPTDAELARREGRGYEPAAATLERADLVG